MLSRFILFSLNIFCIGALFAQDQLDFRGQVQAIDSLVESRFFEEAFDRVVLCKESLQNTSLEREDSIRLYFYSKLSFLHYQLDSCDLALEFSFKEVLLRDSLYGKADLLFLSSLRNHGIYQLNCGYTKLGDSTLSLLLKIHQENVGKVDEIYVRTLDDLAFTKAKLGLTGKAVSIYRDLLKLLENNRSGFYYSVLDSYTSLLINNELYEEASPYYEELKSWYKGNPGYAEFLRDFNNVFIYIKDYVKIFETSSELLSIENDESISMKGARAAVYIGRVEAAISFYDKAYENFEDSVLARIQIHIEKADVYNAYNQNFKQVRELQQAKALHDRNDLIESNTYKQTILKLGTIYTEIGEFELADNLFSEYIQQLESKSSKDYLKLAQAYQSLGNQKYLLRDFEGADYNLNKAIRILSDQDLMNTTEYASSLNSLGALKEALANYDLAKSYYSRAFSISESEEVGLRLKIASAANLANIINTFNPLNDSISFLYSRSITWQKSLTGENHPDYGNLLNKRGLAFQKNGFYDSAESDYKLARQVLEYTVGSSHPEYLVSTSNLGLLYSEQGKSELALEKILETKALYEKYFSRDHPGYVLTINNLANLYTRTNEFEKAEELFLLLSDIQLKEITESFSYLSESEKKTFVDEKKKFMENLKKYIVARYVEAENKVNDQILTKWFELELNVKGILLNSTKKVRNQIFESGNEELIRLFSNWTLAREQVADLQSLKNDRDQNTKRQLDSLMVKIDEIEKTISRTSTEFGTAFSNANITFDDIKNKLLPNECSIEIVRIDFDKEIIYVALYIESTSSAPELIVIGKGDPMDEKSFSTYKNVIKYKVANSVPYVAYWAPLQERINQSDIDKIYLTPDGIYHKVSVVTLFDEANNEYLLDRYDLIQLTSSKDIIRVKERALQSVESNKELLLVGRPSYKFGGEVSSSTVQMTRSFTMNNVVDLPGTEEEINGISDILVGKDLKVKKYLGDESTEKNFKSNLSSDIIHVATHGFFFDKDQLAKESYVDPMLYSGLLLAGVSDEDTKEKTGEDGILTAYEIMNLGFSNLDMVVLSACETGTGKISSGEGVYGLQRAFFVAGANTLIMSLWKVDDQATKDLMTNFYKGFIKSGNKREAFIAAQKKVKKKYKSPVYWGAFVMVGG